MIADNDSDWVLRAQQTPNVVLVLVIETLLQMSFVFFNAGQLREYIPFIC